jgi:hypothetical protein
MQRSIVRLAPVVLALAAVIAASPALARGEPAKGSVGMTAGTLGIGPEASVALGNTFAVRSNVTFFNLSHDFDSDDVRYNGKARFRSVGLMVDYHVGGSGFFVSAGARLNKNHAHAYATPTTITEIGDEEYTPAEIGTLHAHADFKPISPTLSLGYSGHLTKGLKLGIEAGAMFEGALRVKSLTASNNGVDTDDLEAERQSVEKDAAKYKVYPILQLTAGYHF